MALDILLIDPPGAATHVPNVGLGYICGSLKRRDVKVRVVDLNLRRDDPKRYLALARECTLVGISVKANVYRKALEIAEHILAASPGVPVVLGGPHITIVGERVMAENPSIQYCIRGEGEESLPALLAALHRDDKSHVKGLLWRQDGVVRANPCAYHENLDDLEFPEYSDFDSFEIIAEGFSGRSRLTYPLITSRGCPYGCIYCSVGMVMGRRFRTRSPQNCIAELRKVQERFGIKSYAVLDDTFTQGINRAAEFCRLQLDDSPPFSWMCPNGVRADHFPRDLACLMKRAGCRLVTFGVESSDPQVLAGVKKGVKIETIEEAVRIAKSEGFEVNCFFIVGLPGATIEKDYASLDWVLRNGIKAQFWMLVPYEGTALWDLKTGRMLDDYTRGSTFGPDAHVVYETDDYPAEERREFFCVGNYLSPGGRWIPQESFPGGRFKFSFYVLRKSLVRSPRLGVRVLAGVLAEAVRSLRGLIRTGLGVQAKKRMADMTVAFSRLLKNAAWKLAPGWYGRIVDRLRGPGPTRVRDAVVIVTGAGKGIGRAVALAAAREGARVVAVARTQADLDALTAETGPGILAIQADLSDRSETDRVATLALEKCARVDVLVNNAGVGYFDALEKIPPEKIDAMIDTNFRGAVHMARAVAGPMARRGRGTIINVSSVLGFNAGPSESVYAATKFGLIGFTTALAKELKPSGVTVSAVCPGTVDTDFADNRNAALSASALTPGETAAEVLGCVALGSRIVRVTKNAGRVAREVVHRF